jgi:hypothetical protein
MTNKVFARPAEQVEAISRKKGKNPPLGRRLLRAFALATT